MPSNNYYEEFEKKYEKPVLNGLVVGFSGIDPSVKGNCDCDTNELTDEQLAIVNGEIEKKFNELKILIDSGNVDPYTPEPTPTPSPTPTPILANHEELEGLQGGQDGEHYHLSEDDYNKVRDYPEYSTLANNLQHENLEGLLGGNSSGHYHLTAAERTRVQNYPDYENLTENLNHEELDNLLGGNSSGHYHLTEAERNRVRNYPDYSELEGEINHEELDGLLGGNSDGHYHLTQSEREKLQNYPNYSNLTVNIAVNIDHEKLTNLLGGDNNGHYHMTEAEKQKLSLYPSYSNLSQAVNHEKLSNLQGGQDGEHYHLTEAELAKLQAYPEYEDLDVGGTSNHEELSGLLGGEAAGHFHITGNQLTKLNSLIALFFPDGATQPVIPDGITIYDPYGNLPHGTPPGWEVHEFPEGYVPYDGVHRMYYGLVPQIGNKSSYNLLVAMCDTSTVSFNLVKTEDLSSWSTIVTIQKANYGVRVSDYYFENTTTANFLYYIVIDSANGSNGARYLKGNATSVSSGSFPTKPNTVKLWNSVCYSSLLDLKLFVSSDGWTVKANGTTILNSNGSHCGVRVNPGCAAWSSTQQVFCVTGPDGTATSSDGETWEVHSTAPKDLIDLEYRENLGCFIARGETTKLFYASGDGETWQPVNQTPIPLETVAAVDYNPENEWYCAVGGTGKYAYFSKDLEHWTATTISNSDVTAGSVIYMPSTGLYVLMPTSGNYYYTFNPSNWSDD